MAQNPMKKQSHNIKFKTLLETRVNWNTGKKHLCGLRAMSCLQMGVCRVIDQLQTSEALPSMIEGRVRLHYTDLGTPPNSTLVPTVRNHHQDSPVGGDRPIVFYSNGGVMGRSLTMHKVALHPGAVVGPKVFQIVNCVGMGYRPLVSICKEVIIVVAF